MAHWPAEIGVWLEKNGYPLDDIPEHLPSCNLGGATAEICLYNKID